MQKEKENRSKGRKRSLDLLRKKGNFVNSNIAPKPVQSLYSEKDLLPCDKCLGFFLRNCCGDIELNVLI